jgi:PPOX class probable F420-dependent enzyme
MGVLPESARGVLESDGLAHLVTVNPDGSPQVSIVWVGLEGDDVVSGHLREQQKLRNVRRDPRVALSVETPTPSGSASTSSSTAVPRSRRAVRPSSSNASLEHTSAPT